jgi:hypothetical protein
MTPCELALKTDRYVYAVHQWDLDIEPALRDFLGGNICDLNDAVDWVCYTFDVDATDFIIERTCDVFEEFHGV